MKNLAVIGMGSIAKRHLANLRDLHKTAKIYVVSASGKNEILPNNADAIVGIDTLINLAPDYVIIASPAPYHVEIAEKLLNHNIPVIIEKPLSQNVETCMTFEAFCNKEGRCDVAIAYCLRFLPSAMVVKNYIKKELLGPVYNVNAIVGQYLPSWRENKNYKETVSANKELGGGALLELSHELDYLQWILGDLTLQHSWLRTTDELGISVEDIVDLVLLSEKNSYVTVHMDFIQKAVQRRCEFIGQHGRIVWNLVDNSVYLYQAKGVKILYEEPNYNKNNMYMNMLLAFERQLEGEITELATVGAATKLLRIIDEAKLINKWRP